jgi:hypothetical protein
MSGRDLARNPLTGVRLFSMLKAEVALLSEILLAHGGIPCEILLAGRRLRRDNAVLPESRPPTIIKLQRGRRPGHIGFDSPWYARNDSATIMGHREDQ